MDYLGSHIVAELYGCRSDLLASVQYVTDAMLDAALKSGCTVITQNFHHFSPYGVSGAIIIAESHLSIHTWPEYRYAALDIFTCGETIRPDVALAHLNGSFYAENISSTELRRGSAAMIGMNNPLRVKQAV